MTKAVKTKISLIRKVFKQPLPPRRRAITSTSLEAESDTYKSMTIFKSL